MHHRLPARFLMSNTDPEKCPPANKPEYAFIGRSNVGKSSLINSLTGHKGLAKISGKPGKTRLINHFLVEDSWYLVDLPGYGYAQVSKKERHAWSITTEQFLKNRPNLICIFVLLDLRHKAQKLDLEFMEWLGQSQLPFAMVFTKADKLTKVAQTKQLEAYRNVMLEGWTDLPMAFVTSSTTGKGRDSVLEFIHATNGDWEKGR